ncbi:MAG: hypothetical protein JWR54_441 [Mucilaginibacter sp.]|nr:hypothetical protein [Mucilaginibacter sp.]
MTIATLNWDTSVSYFGCLAEKIANKRLIASEKAFLLSLILQ